MRIRPTVMLLAVILIGFTAKVALADHIIWHSPLGMTTADPRLTVEPYFAPPTAVEINTTAAGDLQWVDLGLVVPSDVKIDAITLCYQLASSQSFISQVRLTAMTFPNNATVKHDDGTDLTNTGPDCYLSETEGVDVEGTITLSLRLNFASPNDWIRIGAIGIHVSPLVSGIGGGGVIDNPTTLKLHQNQPNPFGSATTISYALEQGGQVDLSVFDAGGRLIRSLCNESQVAGDHNVIWDGRDDSGRAVASGTYYYRVRIEDQVASRGMVLLR